MENRYKNNNFEKYIVIFIPIIILLISVGYSAYGTNMNISSIALNVRLNEDIRITGITAVSSTSDGLSRYEEYNKSNFSSGLYLPNESSTVTYKIEITNFSNVEMGILKIDNLPTNLDYTLEDYVLEEKICNNNNECKLGIKKEFYITIKYKEGGYDSSNLDYYINLQFEFSNFYTVTYVGFTENNYPSEVMKGSIFEVSFNNETIPSGIKIEMDNVEVPSQDYSFADNNLKISNVTGNIVITIIKPVSFESDDWATIVANVRIGNTSAYNVGDTKEVNLGELGTHTLRIANNSTPSECNTEGFSQTACGFVIEFADIITTARMNEARDASKGGWRDSEMRAYVNGTIYNSLPTEIKNNIIDTYVVSGKPHGDTFIPPIVDPDGTAEIIVETNYITTDKLYLLSTKEVWGKEGTLNIINYDTAEAETRQLDYYKNNGVTTSSYSGVIKNYNGSASAWWLRSVCSDFVNFNFYSVDSDGNWSTNRGAGDTYGVAPSFRIG